MGAIPLSVDALAKLLNELLMTPELHSETFPNDEHYESFLINLSKVLDTAIGVKLDRLTKHSSDTPLCEVTEYCLWLNSTNAVSRHHLLNNSIQTDPQYSDLVEDSLTEKSNSIIN